MRKKTGNIAVAVAAFMAVAGLGISSGAGRVDVLAANPQTKAEKANSDDSKKDDKSADKKATQSGASEETTAVPETTVEGDNKDEAGSAGIQAEKRLPKGFSIEGLGENIATLDALSNALNSLQEKADAKKFVLDVKGEKLESSFAELGAGISNKEFILSEAEKFTTGNMIERFAKSSELLEKPEKITPDIEFNDDAVKSFLKKANRKNPDAPVDATIKRVNGAFEITPEKEGYAIDADSTLSKLREAVLKDNEETIVADVTKQKPSVTAEELGSIKDVLGTFTTNYSSSTSERATNIAVGTAKMDGVLLMPGETLSGYERMQPFTINNGYKMAKAYQNGLVIDSVGGGACQIATTLYQAALRAEITITERKNHSMIVGYVQPSGDAAIAGDYKDIKVTNNRKTPIYVEAITSGRDVTFTIWGKEDRPAGRTIEFVSEVLSETPKGKTYIDDNSKSKGYIKKESDGHKGRVSKLWKIVKETGVEVSKDLISSDTYRKADDIYIRGTRSTAPAAPAPVAPAPSETQASESDNSGPADTQAPPETQAPDVSQGPAFDPNLNPGQ